MLVANQTTEVAQQSKARGKDDFLIAFSPVSSLLLCMTWG